MTDELFRRDAYAKTCESTVTGADERGLRLAQTVFYPLGGGQPGDFIFADDAPRRTYTDSSDRNIIIF